MNSKGILATIQDLINDDGDLSVMCKGWVDKTLFVSVAQEYLIDYYGDENIIVEVPIYTVGRWTHGFENNRRILETHQQFSQGAFKITIADANW